MNTYIRDSMVRKVQALLKMSNSTLNSSVQERSEAFDLAMKLMEKYGIRFEDLRVQETGFAPAPLTKFVNTRR